ncbi:MAG: hypothetical protein OXF74_14195 [Rhodobacteraceae bacterium]|nr:hypothetical protein [Paracoccaceae bacterium]
MSFYFIPRRDTVLLPLLCGQWQGRQADGQAIDKAGNQAFGRGP